MNKIILGVGYMISSMLLSMVILQISTITQNTIITDIFLFFSFFLFVLGLLFSILGLIKDK